MQLTSSESVSTRAVWVRGCTVLAQALSSSAAAMRTMICNAASIQDGSLQATRARAWILRRMSHLSVRKFIIASCAGKGPRDMGQRCNIRAAAWAEQSPGMRLLFAAITCAACAGCVGLPPLEGRVESHALADTQETRLARAVQPIAAQHAELTGIHAMPRGTDAFAARVLLAQAAERSIDAQYYIWHADQTGLLLMEALRDAARRGVRVRFLMDDQTTRGMDALLSAFAATPNVEVRLYNPFPNRTLRSLGYLGEFSRLNRRMHNKSFIVDNQAAIVGGRNIGNEYFGAGDEIPFMDLDVIALGHAVPELSAQFDLYWNSASAYPIASIVGKPTPEDLDARFSAAREDAVSAQYLAALRETPLVSDLLAHRLALEWVAAKVVRDDPAKTRDPDPDRATLALAQIFEATGAPQRSFDLISPYFVPGTRGTTALEDLARRGVAVRVLTNSLASNDVAVVHSGYAKRRCALATAGVRLYELKPTRILAPAAGDLKPTAKSLQALHAKTFSVDRRYVFVGSFNFDLRSGLLNTELGLVLRSPGLAERLEQALDSLLPKQAYEVRPVAGDACVEWIEHTAAGEVRMEDEPDSTAWGRFWLAVWMSLPIDWML